jgi:Spy/CpxP family protein refolding chaperone
MAGMKSAVELAMEKLGKLQSDEPQAALTDEQRQQIHNLRQQYDAKIAEKEIMMQSELRKLIQSRPPQEAAMAAHGLQEQFQETKKSLLHEMEEKIAAVRSA